MLDSLRFRLWMSYIISILLSLLVVMIGLFWILKRSPLVYRQVALRVQLAGEILADNLRPELIESTSELEILLKDRSEELQVDLLVFVQTQEIITSPGMTIEITPERLRRVLRNNDGGGEVLPFRDVNGRIWFYSVQKLGMNNYLFAFAPRPRLSIRQFLSNELISPLIFAGILGVILAVILSLVIGDSLISPLQKMIRATKNLPTGKYENLALEGPREVRQLARAYNEMNSEVQASRKSQQDFVANVSHELKTPITSIQGFSQAILDDAVQGEEGIKNAARVIYSESERMHRLVNDLLSLSKLETGMVEFDFEDLRVSDLILFSLESLNFQIEEKSIQVQTNISDEVIVLGDRHRLLQAFTNLIVNAIKFSNTNDLIIFNVFSDKDNAFIQVKDHGVGIPYEDQNRIFERFYQVEKSRSGNMERGMGLGLAITREIIESHKGSLQFESIPGNGSTFTVKIPRFISENITNGEK